MTGCTGVRWRMKVGDWPLRARASSRSTWPFIDDSSAAISSAKRDWPTSRASATKASSTARGVLRPCAKSAARALAFAAMSS